MFKNTVLASFYTAFSFLLIFCCSCRQREPEVASVSDAVAETPADSVKPAIEPAVLEVAGGNERDLGTISEHDVVPLEFPLRNAGASALTVIDATFSCPCGELLNPPENLALAPGETYTLKLNLFAHKIPLGDFSRFLSLDLGNEQFFTITIRGHIKANFDISPGRVVDLGVLTDSGALWEKELQIRGFNQLAEGFRLAADPKADLFELQLEQGVPGTYTLKVRPKNSLPYKRRFLSHILLPILEPSGLPDLKIAVRGQIGEDIVFRPASFSFRESDFSDSATLVRLTSIGIVPKNEKEAGDSGVVSGRKKSVGQWMFRSSSRRPISSIAWAPLFEHLEFDCPVGVRVEKELHDNGISLQLHISRSAFAENRQISIIPRRDQNLFRKISLRMVRAGTDNSPDRSGDADNADADEADEENAE